MYTALNFFLILGTLILAPKAYSSCVVAIPDDCLTGKVCAKFNEKGEAKCFDVPQVAPIIFDLPFDNATEVVCAQSGRFSTATHIYRNMLYAIDLATPYHKSPSIIRASADGKAFIFSECNDPSGSPQQTKTDSCGDGYGNHVRILHVDGYMSLYAHLTNVKVKDGEMVKKHQILATEGATGQAAYRHLHWDVHKMEGAKESWEKQLANPAWGGYSVPFKFAVNINGTEKIIDSSTIACRWLDMKQPVWRGTYKP